MSNLQQSKTDTDQHVVDLVDDLAGRMRRGESVDLEAFAAEHAEHADALRELFPALELLAQLSLVEGDASVSAAGPAPRPADAFVSMEGTLGDFRIQREIGRGGMGVVYEAQQISLGRKVALKVLPFAAMLDQRQLARFQNEARAAASLDHPNIVSVHSVGCERGVHYYAMRYIEGRTLADVVEELRRTSGTTPKQAADEPTGEYPASPSADTKREVQARISTEGSHQSREYFRSVAQLGVQAAGALEHAHQTGVVHRDVKPSNLMVDAGGHLWVTDFGLAMVETGPDLTMTGDLLGTLRYMSPEQAEGGRRVLDHRTDVYSLGLTLYELLTLQAAFDGSGRQALLRRILQVEPVPPRQLNPAIPADLETIVLKSIAKNPAERYATAGDLADDLEQFLADKPIRARRPTLLKRAAKWSRRHQAVVWSAVAILLLATIGLKVSNMLIAAERAAAIRQRNEANRNAERAYENFHSAMHALTGLAWRLNSEDLASSPHAEELRTDTTKCVRRFMSRFLEEGSSDPLLRRQTGAAYVHLGRIHIVMGDRAKARESYSRATAVFDSLAADFPSDHQPLMQLAMSQWIFGDHLYVNGQPERAREQYRLASRNYGRALKLAPNEPHYVYAWFLTQCPDPQLRDAARAGRLATKALRHDDQNATAWFAAGAAHYRQGRWDSVIQALQRALELAEESGKAPRTNQYGLFLAMAYWKRGDKQEAHRCYDRTIKSIERYEHGFEDDVPLRAEAAELLGLSEETSDDRPSETAATNKTTGEGAGVGQQQPEQRQSSADKTPLP